VARIAFAGVLALAAAVALWAPGARAATASAAGEPWCDTIAPGEMVEACALSAAGLMLSVRVADGRTTLEQARAADLAPVSTTEIETWSVVPVPPGLRDLNDDGVPELLVPLGAGNANIAWAVFEKHEEDFVRRGSLTGGMIDGFETRNGLILSSARASAYSYEKTGQSISPHGIAAVYALFVDFSRAPGAYCSVEYAEALSAYGLDEEGLLAQCEKEAAEALN